MVIGGNMLKIYHDEEASLNIFDSENNAYIVDNIKVANTIMKKEIDEVKYKIFSRERA